MRSGIWTYRLVKKKSSVWIFPPHFWKKVTAGHCLPTRHISYTTWRPIVALPCSSWNVPGQKPKGPVGCGGYPLSFLNCFQLYQWNTKILIIGLKNCYMTKICVHTGWILCVSTRRDGVEKLSKQWDEKIFFFVEPSKYDTEGCGYKDTLKNWRKSISVTVTYCP